MVPKRNLQIILAAVFGITFLTAILVITLAIPTPTDWQKQVFRITLALAAGGVAAMIPGILKVRIHHFLTAGGALAVFATVYFYPPAGVAEQRLAIPKPYVATQSVLVQQQEDAKRLFEISFKKYMLGLSKVSEVIIANNKYLEAELSLDPGSPAQIDAYKNGLKRANELESRANQLALVGAVSQTDITETRLHRTQIEVGLARLQSGSDK